jgi:preprotein translocase subunit SecG
MHYALVVAIILIWVAAIVLALLQQRRNRR